MDTDEDQPDRRPAGVGAGADRATVVATELPTGVRVISTGAILDAAGAAELRREFSALLARSAHPLVVDLTAVRAVESGAAAVVLRHLAYEAGDADVDLRVVRDPGAHVARAVFGDESLFEVYPTLDAALGRPTDVAGTGRMRPSTG